MKHTIDELLLQRCVDGELTDHERADLLSKLHAQGSIENWKSLALSFVEHQVFSKVFADDSDSGKIVSFQLAKPAPPRLKGDSAAPVPWWHRRVRPWVSIAASLLVGMLAGLGGHFMLEMEEGAPADIAMTKAPEFQQLANLTPPAGTAIAASHPSTTSGEPGTHTPVMNVHLTGLGNRGASPVAVPVYAPEHWQAMQLRHPPTMVPEDVQRMLEAQGMIVDHQRYWYRAPLKDGREILVPTETMHVRHAIQ